MEAGCIPFAWDINAATYKIVDRAALATGDQYDLDGIMQGAASARTAYDAIYPEPTTPSGIDEVKMPAAADNNVYDLSGRIVKTDVSHWQNENFLPGVYVYNHKKYVIR